MVNFVAMWRSWNWVWFNCRQLGSFRFWKVAPSCGHQGTQWHLPVAIKGHSGTFLWPPRDTVAPSCGHQGTQWNLSNPTLVQSTKVYRDYVGSRLSRFIQVPLQLIPLLSIITQSSSSDMTRTSEQLVIGCSENDPHTRDIKGSSPSLVGSLADSVLPLLTANSN